MKEWARIISDGLNYIGKKLDAIAHPDVQVTVDLTETNNVLSEISNHLSEMVNKEGEENKVIVELIIK